MTLQSSAADPGAIEALDAFDAIRLIEALRVTVRVLEDHAPWLDSMSVGAAPPGLIDGSMAGEPSGFDQFGPAAGSDMAATLGAAVLAAEESRDFAALAAALRDGSRAGAQGRAGKRLAGFIGGMADVLVNIDRLDGLRMALALEAGAERLTARDDGSHPGGFPAVAAVAADGALAAADDGSALAEVLVSAADTGLEELLQGPQVNDALAARGTVDATAASFLLIIDSLASVVTGVPLPSVPVPEQGPVIGGVAHRYEVRCHVAPHEGPDIAAADDLEVVLSELGELSEFDGLGATWTLRLRTPLPGAAVEAICECGRPSEMRIAVVDDPE